MKTTETIKALRDALDIALDLANAEVESLRQSYGDRLPHKHKSAADDVQTIKSAIAALTADASEDAPDEQAKDVKTLVDNWMYAFDVHLGGPSYDALREAIAARPAPVAAPDHDDMLEPDAYLYRTACPWDITLHKRETKGWARVEPIYFVTESQKRQFFGEAPVAATPAPDDLAPLFKFYNVTTLEELARIQDQHIARLQAKLPKLGDFSPRTPREG